MDKRKESLFRFWTIIGFGMFLYQSVLIFFTVFIKSYPSGQVIIYTNSIGELIFEIILSGLVVIISFICLVISVIPVILNYKKNKEIKNKWKKKINFITLILIFVLLANQNNYSNFQTLQDPLQEPEAAVYTFDLNAFDLTHTRGNTYCDFTLNFTLDDIYIDKIGTTITGIYFEIDGEEIGYCKNVINGENTDPEYTDGELYGYSNEGTLVEESVGQILHGTTEQYIIPNADFYNDGSIDGG